MKSFSSRLRLAAIIIFQSLGLSASAQCFTNTLNVSTGWNPPVSAYVPLTPSSTDPRWRITYHSTDAAAIPGVTSVGSAAPVVNPSSAGWTSAPASRWLSIINPPGISVPSTGSYETFFERIFCTQERDELRFDFSVAHDDNIEIFVDGNPLPLYSLLGANSGFTVYTPAPVVYTLPAGLHTIRVELGNVPDDQYPTNPTGFTFDCTVTSTSSSNSLISEASNCAQFACNKSECSDICYWKVEGNNILNGNNLFGTLTNDEVRIVTNFNGGSPQRGVFSAEGRFGWNSNALAPTALLHLDCDGYNDPNDPASLGPSDVRFEHLETGKGTMLVIDKDGYVTNSQISPPPPPTIDWHTNGNVASATDFLGTINPADLRILTNNTERMRVTSAGRVGVGLPNPDLQFQVHNTVGDQHASLSGAAPSLRLHNLTSWAGSNSQGRLGLATGATHFTNTSAANDLVLHAVTGNLLFATNSSTGPNPNGLERMRINYTNGFVGINTTAPTDRLHVVLNAGENVNFTGVPAAPLPNQYDHLVIAPSGDIFRGPAGGGGGLSSSCSTNNVVPKVINPSTGALGCSQIIDIASGVGINMTPSTWTLLGTEALISGSPASPSPVRLDVNGLTRTTTLVVTSDGNLKREIQPIADALEIVHKLAGKTYRWNQSEAPYDKGLHHGFIAQELVKIVPDAVVVDDKGQYAVNYLEIIPILTEAIKEQDRKIEALLAQAKENGSSSGVGTQATSSIPHYLAQNIPNPFGTETTIEYTVVAMQRSACIMVYDLNGREVSRHPIAKAGPGRVTVNGRDLVSGVYMYSLIVDGQEMASKRMVLAK